MPVTTEQALNAKCEKIVKLMAEVLVFYYRHARNNAQRRLIINVAESALKNLVVELKKVMRQVEGCPPGMVEARNGDCVPR